jgi:hypothetical protein
VSPSYPWGSGSAKMLRGCILSEMAVPDIEKAQPLRAVEAKRAFGGSRE